MLDLFCLIYDDSDDVVRLDDDNVDDFVFRLDDHDYVLCLMTIVRFNLLNL